MRKQEAVLPVSKFSPIFYYFCFVFCFGVLLTFGRHENGKHQAKTSRLALA